MILRRQPSGKERHLPAVGQKSGQQLACDRAIVINHAEVASKATADARLLRSKLASPSCSLACRNTEWQRAEAYCT